MYFPHIRYYIILRDSSGTVLSLTNGNEVIECMIIPLLCEFASDLCTDDQQKIVPTT